MDAALEARLGRLDPETAEAIQDESALAFIVGMPRLEALDLARGLVWTAHGHPARCSAAEMIDLLAGDELPAERRARLADVLEVARATGRRRQVRRVESCRAVAARWQELALLGWSLDLALEILAREATGAADEPAPTAGTPLG